MNELTFNDIILRIEDMLREADDDEVAFYYNQLFETPIIAIGDGLWEEEILEDFIEDDDE